jgi:gamma-glutamyltranspeptidase/glutathione hydrolase
MWDRREKRADERSWTTRSEHGVVTSSHYLASRAGASMLARGGNAIDAAVATSLALSVCEPGGSGLGGMILMLVFTGKDKRTFVIEGDCQAPALATPQAVSVCKSRYHGYGAVAVPRQIATLRHALDNYGRLSRAEVLEPAIRLAADGFALTKLASELIADYAKGLRKSSARAIFLTDDGKARSPGEWFRQPTLARTLLRLEKEGFEDFYCGEIADQISRDMEANGGFVRLADLEEAVVVQETEPLGGEYRGEAIRAVGPPAGGVSLVQMLQMASFADRELLDLREPESLPLVAGIIQRCREDRRKFRLRTGARNVGEARERVDLAYAERAFDEVLSKIRELRSKGGAAGSTTATRELRGPSGETSHFNVVDEDGNVVAATQSIERSFGAAVCTDSLGFLYNGYLRAFKVRNRKHPHYLTPGAPARSNAAPTLVFRGGNPYVAIGSTGAERMLSGMLETLLRLDHESAFEAVRGARLHCSPEGIVQLELDRLPQGTKASLERCGFVLQELDPYSFKMGGLQLAVSEEGVAHGVADPRRDGAAVGPAYS